MAPAQVSPVGDGDGKVWSGLETPGMTHARCSLILGDKASFEARIKPLSPQRVVVYQDKGSNQENYNVDFSGCTILQLEPETVAGKDDGQEAELMPVTITVGGRCHLTRDSYQDFRIMMRTPEQATQMNMPPNGNFEWPDVQSFLLCPVCGTEATPPSSSSSSKSDNTEYWMIFYPILQMRVENHKMTVGTRTICRLGCRECFEKLVSDLTLKVSSVPPDLQTSSTALSWSLPVLEVLEDAGSVSFLGEGPPIRRPPSFPSPEDVMDAWTLYSMWEQSGAWEALQHDYRDILSRSMGGAGMEPKERGGKDGGWKANPDSINEQPMLELKLADRFGKKCDNPACDRVHGRSCSVTGERVKLHVPCEACKGAHYCSIECRTMNATEHKPHCLARQEELHKKRGRQEAQCNTCKVWLPYSSMKKCSRCKKATYCSVDCQKNDWKQHKPSCVKA